MKTRSLLALSIVALLCASGLKAQVSTQFYAGANVGYTTTSWKDVKSGFAVGVNGGAIIEKQHYVELEVFYMKNDLKDMPAESGVVNIPGSGNFNVTTKTTATLTTIPVLATYRYEYVFADTPWSVQGGGSLGFANQKFKTTTTATATQGNISATDTESDSTSKTVMALGAQALAVYKISDKFSANAGIKWIWTDKMDKDSNAGSFTMLTVGASYRF